MLQRARRLAENMDSTVLCWAHTAKDLSIYWSTPLGPAGSVQSFSFPVGSFTIHPWIRTGQLCTAGKGDSSVFCPKKRATWESDRRHKGWTALEKDCTRQSHLKCEHYCSVGHMAASRLHFAECADSVYHHCLMKHSTDHMAPLCRPDAMSHRAYRHGKFITVNFPYPPDKEAKICRSHFAQ